MKAFFILSTFLILLFLMPVSIRAQEQGKKHRLDASFSYEYLSPNEVYGSWKTLSLGFYNKFSNDFTGFAQMGAFSRKEGDAFLSSFGAYKDWTDRLYTYSALTFGTNSEYLPNLRVDHDFNFKFGKEKNIVWLVGASYIKYFDVHKDLILSTGLNYYHGSWILGYRIFRNESDPNSVVSYSHLVSAGYGKEKWQWTYLDISLGKQAYLASYLINPTEVRQDSFFVSLKHRRWLGADYGILGDINFFKLKDGYEKYGLSMGFFKEF